MATTTSSQVIVSAPAAEAMNTLSNSDPVLAPLSVDTVAALAGQIADGVEVMA